jgi:L,D-peptidoglycan transpeptidase YkuD (ErfK/YbiS/YcfS/YnhG family)
LVFIRLLLLTLLIACTSAQSNGATLEHSQQLVLVVTADWNATQGVLRTFDRGSHGWAQRNDSVAVSIGASGSAWGLGLHGAQPGPQKSEGDGRSPAGIFRIGAAFGYATAEPTGLEYQALTEQDYCIDVSDSPHYNRIVNKHVVGQAAVEGSTEPMRRDIHAQGDQRYKRGFVIEHNPDAVAAKGSCIFAHLWATPGQATVGCTAMDDSAMRDLLTWLEQNKQPIFVLLPQSAYVRVAESWGLPEHEAAQ